MEATLQAFITKTLRLCYASASPVKFVELCVPKHINAQVLQEFLNGHVWHLGICLGYPNVGYKQHLQEDQKSESGAPRQSVSEIISALGCQKGSRSVSRCLQIGLFLCFLSCSLIIFTTEVYLRESQTHQRCTTESILQMRKLRLGSPQYWMGFHPTPKPVLLPHCAASG